MKELAKYLNEAIDKNRERLFALSQQIWEYAEVGFQEYRSAEALKAFLIEEGFTVQSGVAGIPTAFVASYGSGKPSIGFLGEYDALYDLSQEPGNPQRKAFQNGKPINQVNGKQK